MTLSLPDLLVCDREVDAILALGDDLPAWVLSLSAGERHDLAGLLSWAEEDRRLHPLAWARLWHNDEPLTSQRRAVANVLAPGLDDALLVGGNRSGKTESAAMLACAFLRGRDDPEVQRWGARNELDVSRIQSHPGRVWADSLSSTDSMRVIRPKVSKYLPPETDEGCWRNRYGVGEASVRLPWGEPGGQGELVFKSIDQKRRGHQGDEIDLGWVDEEPEDRGVVEEIQMRTIDRGGLFFLSFTPLYGLTWVWEQWIKGLQVDPHRHEILAPQHRVTWIWGEHNPHIRQDKHERRIAALSDAARAARGHGEFVALQGSVWPQFGLANVIPNAPIPADWERYAAIDWGTSNPTHIVWAAHDPRDNVIVVYDEWVGIGTTIAERADAIREHETAHREEPEYISERDARHVKERKVSADVLIRWADPAQADVSRSITVDHGIDVSPARKEVEHGILLVMERLALDETDLPHLVFMERCVETRRSVSGYVRDEKTGKPRKLNDHGADATRYLVEGINRLYPLFEDDEEGE